MGSGRAEGVWEKGDGGNDYDREDAEDVATGTRAMRRMMGWRREGWMVGAALSPSLPAHPPASPSCSISYSSTPLLVPSLYSLPIHPVPRPASPPPRSPPPASLPLASREPGHVPQQPDYEHEPPPEEPVPAW